MAFNARFLHGTLLHIAFTVLDLGGRLGDAARTATVEGFADLERKAKDKIRNELTKLIDLLEKD